MRKKVDIHLRTTREVRTALRRLAEEWGTSIPAAIEMMVRRNADMAPYPVRDMDRVVTNIVAPPPPPPPPVETIPVEMPAPPDPPTPAIVREGNEPDAPAWIQAIYAAVFDGDDVDPSALRALKLYREGINPEPIEGWS